MAEIKIDQNELRPIVELVTREVLAGLKLNQPAVERLAYSEAEAARLLGINRHVLRDERRRNRIQASRIVGNRIRYSHDDLTAYLAKNRTGT
ncbi:MAG: helix-turn-helix domain-containing protein [Planctomycetes bacterium]|nr:helix-turn-helix domain-containing protein [Planctomycetota bacterium]